MGRIYYRSAISSAFFVDFIGFFRSIYRRAGYDDDGSAIYFASLWLYDGFGSAISKEGRVVGGGCVFTLCETSRRFVDGSEIASICGLDVVAAFMRRARVWAGGINGVCDAIYAAFVQASYRRVLAIGLRILCVTGGAFGRLMD